MINKKIQDYIDYLLFLKYDRQLVWSNTTIAEMSDKHLVNAIKYLEQHNPNHKMKELYVLISEFTQDIYS